MDKNQFTTKSLLALVIVIVIAFFFYSNSQSQKQQDVKNVFAPDSEEFVILDTSEWRVCRNEKMGYEFKYPKPWLVYGEGSVSTTTGTYKTTPCVGPNVSVTNTQAESKPTHVFTVKVDSAADLGALFPDKKELTLEDVAGTNPSTEFVLKGERFIGFTREELPDALIFAGFRGDKLYTFFATKNFGNVALQAFFDNFNFTK